MVTGASRRGINDKWREEVEEEEEDGGGCSTGRILGFVVVVGAKPCECGGNDAGGSGKICWDCGAADGASAAAIALEAAKISKLAIRLMIL